MQHLTLIASQQHINDLHREAERRRRHIDHQRPRRRFRLPAPRLLRARRDRRVATA
jgi:hypothetical protein